MLSVVTHPPTSLPPSLPPNPLVERPHDIFVRFSVARYAKSCDRLVGRSEGRPGQVCRVVGLVGLVGSEGPLITIWALIYAWAANGRKIRLVMHNSSHFSGESQQPLDTPATPTEPTTFEALFTSSWEYHLINIFPRFRGEK